METPNSDSALDQEFEDMQKASGEALGESPVRRIPEEAPAPAAAPAAPAEAPQPAPEPSPAPAPAPAASEKPAEEQKPPAPRRERPEAYIPLAKYHDEKRTWDEEKQRLAGIVEGVSSFLGGIDPTSEKGKALVATYVEKTGLSEEDARAALQQTFDLMLPPEARDQMKQVVEGTAAARQADQAAEAAKKEQEFFENEYSTFAPSLALEYPTATEEQKAEARALMDKLSHLRKYARNDLSEVYALNRAKFDEIFAAGGDGTGQAPQGDRRGPERSHAGQTQATVVTASDFRKGTDGKYDFAKLHEMEEGSDKDRLVSSLDPDAYVAYIDDLGVRDLDQGITVRRSGQTVSLR